MRPLRETLFVLLTLGFLLAGVLFLRIYLPLLGQPVPGFFFARFEWDSEVHPDTRAARAAGLEHYDIVLELNGTPLTPGVDPAPFIRRELGAVNRVVVGRRGRAVPIEVPVRIYAFHDLLDHRGFGFLVAWVYLVLGAAVYRLRPREPASWPFFLFCASIGYALCDFGDYLRGVGTTVTFAGAAFISPTAAHFVLDFAGPGWFPRLRRALLPALYAAGAAITVWHFAAMEVWADMLQHGMVQLVASSMTAMVVVFSVWLLGFVAWRSSVALTRQRARVLMFGIVVAYALPSAELVANSVARVQLIPAWVTYSLLAVYPCTVAYAMARHRLFDFDVVLRKGLAYALLSGALTLVYAAGLALMNSAFAGRVGAGGEAGRAPFLAYVVFSVLLIVFLDRARVTVQAGVDRLYFRRRVDYRRALRRASEAMTSRLRQEEILDSALGAIRGAMAVEWGAVYLAGGDGNELRMSASFGGAPVTATSRLPERLDAEDALVRQLESGRRSISRYDRPVLEDPALGDRFVAAGAALAVPLVAEERLIGVLLLGEKRNGHAYGGADHELLETLANQSGIALMNARAVETIRELNLSLEEKVRARTAELEAANAELARSEADTRRAYGELYQAQARLVQAEKMAALGALVAGVAHELNTPIGAMAGSIDVIRRAAERLGTARGPEDVARAREVISTLTRTTAESCERVEGIVRNLRAFARLDEAEAKVVDLHEGIESTLALLRHLTDRRIRVERRYGPLPAVSCIPSQLNQVFMHLVTNACQAIEGEGIITIATDVHGGGARIRVSDSGRGIPAEDLPRVFDPGFTTKRGVGVGLGLGLSISQRVVSAHGGTIEAESAPGRGSTFTVMLPLGRAEVASEAGPEARPAVQPAAQPAARRARS